MVSVVGNGKGQFANTRRKLSRKLASKARLKYVSDSEPGFVRMARGKGFRYCLPSGKPLKAVGHLARIEALGIPPAWTDVWICRQANGHLQCTGRDDRQRKQYLYHERWQQVVANAKFDHLLEVGEVLPDIRKAARRDLKQRGLPRSKVVALAVRLLDETAIRVGNAEYARDNDSHGLTTLRDRHVRFSKGAAVFSFEGKSGIHQRVELHEPRLTRLLKKCRDLRGRHLLQYRGEDQQPRRLTSDDVNRYLAEVTDEVMTAKDFRTWRATAMVAALLAAEPCPDSERKRKQKVTTAMRAAAEVLGNTLAVCRKAYIHHGLVEAYLSGSLSKHAQDFRSRKQRWYTAEEQLLLHLLEKI